MRIKILFLLFLNLCIQVHALSSEEAWMCFLGLIQEEISANLPTPNQVIRNNIPPVKKIEIGKNAVVYPIRNQTKILGMNMRPIPGDYDRSLALSFNQQMRQIAEEEGKIFINTPLQQLPTTNLPRSYTWVLLEDGTVVFGQVDNVWEIGVKHINLAAGKTVLAAGEMKMGNDLSIIWNLESGSFSRKIMESIGEEELLETASEVFKVYSDSRYQPQALIKKGDQSLLPTGNPTIEELAKLCQDSRFLEVAQNREFCL
jgi:hypothetical protein